MITAATLAQELDRTPDRIGAIARRLGIVRVGRDWIFTPAQAQAIRAFVLTAKPGRKAGRK